MFVVRLNIVQGVYEQGCCKEFLRNVCCRGITNEDVGNPCFKVMIAEDNNIVYNGCITQCDGYLVHELPAFFHHLPVDHCGLLGLRRLLVRLERVLHQSDQTGAPPRIPGHFFSAR